MTLNKSFTKSENVAAKKLCGEGVALEIPRKLTFCNVGGCKTEVLMELCYTREIYLKFLRRGNLTKVSFLKLLTKENLLGPFQELATY